MSKAGSQMSAASSSTVFEVITTSMTIRCLSIRPTVTIALLRTHRASTSATRMRRSSRAMSSIWIMMGIRVIRRTITNPRRTLTWAIVWLMVTRI